MNIGKSISGVLINNAKGVIFKAVGVAVGGIAAMLLSDAVEGGLNKKFNQELEVARARFEDNVNDILSEPVASQTTFVETDNDNSEES